MWKQLAILIVLGIPSVLSAGEAEDRELLQRVAATYRKNQDKLRTWSGEVHVTDPRGVSDESTSTRRVTFHYDVKSGNRRWQWDDSKSNRQRSGVVFNAVAYNLDFLSSSDGHVRRDVSILDARSEPRGFVSDNFNPMHYFGYGGQDIGRLFDFMSRSPQTAGVSLTVSLQGSLVTATYNSPSGLTNRYTVDLDKGGNLVEFYANEPGNGVWHWSAEYQEVAGVFVPRKVKDESDQVNRKDSHHTAEWTESKVNEPLPDDAFDLTKVGLQRGDDVYDTRTKKSSRVDGPPFLPAAADRETQPADKNKTPANPAVDKSGE